MNELEDIIVIQNGERVPNTFPKAEYDRRLGLLRRHMAGADIDVALFSSYQCINYYCDFLFCHFGRFFALVVDQETQTSLSANIDGANPCGAPLAIT